MGGPRGAKPSREKGFTLLEVLIGLGILTIVSTGLYQAYASVLDIVQSGQYNAAAVAIIQTQVETVRNMRYEDVGTAAGVPTGKIPQQETTTVGGISYTLHNYVRNIDDPFDGILGGTPNDTAPADYKLVQFQVTCDSCTRYNIISMATYVAPKNLESSSKRGNLFVRVFDAAGQPVVGATVHITNTKVSPAINLTDVTGATGQLQLVDTATVSAGYHITATKSGYSSDQTYPPGTPPNPINPDATVANQQLTITSLAIDRVSSLTVQARDQFCMAVPGMDFLLTGGKLIGTSPNTPKYSQSQATNASGTASITNLEWDAYTIAPTDTVWDIAGTTASLAWNVNPNTATSMAWLIASRSASGLVVAVRSSTGVPLDGATVRMTKTGYDVTNVTARSRLVQTDWSAGQYDSKSSNLTAGASLTMTSSGSAWLISNTFNLGTSSATFQDINWNPTIQPPLTNLQFQLAANNDNATWSFVGPDGTPSSFYTSPGAAISPTLNGNRYLRYRATLTSSSGVVTPTVADLSVGFSSGCLPTGQAYFNGLTPGLYTVQVSLPGFQPYVGTLTIANNWTMTNITLSP